MVEWNSGWYIANYIVIVSIVLPSEIAHARLASYLKLVLNYGTFLQFLHSHFYSYQVFDEN